MRWSRWAALVVPPTVVPARTQHGLLGLRFDEARLQCRFTSQQWAFDSLPYGVVVRRAAGGGPESFVYGGLRWVLLSHLVWCVGPYMGVIVPLLALKRLHCYVCGT